MVDLAVQTWETMNRHKLLPKGQGVLVATSGGVDSMVLLHVMRRLGVDNRWTVVAGHFNHRLRGRSSTRDERLVRRVCEKWKIPFHRGEGDVRAYAGQNGLSLEMAARDLRHAFLARTALECGITTIATGHHADDQVELFLLRLIRGAGTGLAGMKYWGPSPADARARLIRPLLGRHKASLYAYARRHRIEFREDDSNRDAGIPRNRIRNVILPAMCRLQPSCRSAVLRSMEIMAAETEFSKAAADRWLARRSGARFDRLHLAVQRQAIQAQLLALGICPGFDLIESLRANVAQPVAVSPNCVVARDELGCIHRRVPTADSFDDSEGRIRMKGIRGEVEFDGLNISWRLDRQRPDDPPRGVATKGSEWFDAVRVGDVVVLRHWRPGDRFQPIGMPHSVKLQDFFSNQKIPRGERRRLVVATTDNGEIFWVEGNRIGERFKLDSATTRRLGWKWARVRQAAGD